MISRTGRSPATARRPFLALATLLVAVVCAACTGVTTGEPAAGRSTGPAAAPAAQRGDYDAGTLNILPPGTQGTYTSAEYSAYTKNGTRPPHTVDQWTMYDALNTADPARLTDGSLTSYYKAAPVRLTPGQVVSTERPRPGVTIQRDRFGVPHVIGTTDADAAYGAGYASTEDRMFLQDALRHAGSAHIAEFLGATPANIKQDAAQLRAVDYTPAEAAAQVTDLVRRDPVNGPALLARAQAYLDGINAAQRAMCPTVTAPRCPVEYSLLHKTPQPLTRADLVYMASLVGGLFGKGGGGEAANAAWLQQLQAKYGPAAGRKIFDDLRESDDPEAPTTIPTTFPYGQTTPADPAAVALPDLNGKTAPATGAQLVGARVKLPTPSAWRPPTRQAATVAAAAATRLRAALTAPPAMSNALVVGAQHSATGHPIAVFGPQTGYTAPQLLEEIAIDSPHIYARGAAFVGGAFVVELGHGEDYAWSATSAGDDLVDTVVERLCNADGTKATLTSTGYLDGTRCVSMVRPDHVDGTVRLLDLRTRHGIVQQRTTVGGVPVAIVQERSTYGHEIDSLQQFAQVGDPTVVHDAASFVRVMSGMAYTFNWFYVDDKDIAYANSGLLPRRAPGVDWALPRWGDATWDWRGALPDSVKPHAIDPPQGYFANWNNKPSPGFSAADNEWGWGSGAAQGRAEGPAAGPHRRRPHRHPGRCRRRDGGCRDGRRAGGVPAARGARCAGQGRRGFRRSAGAGGRAAAGLARFGRAPRRPGAHRRVLRPGGDRAVGPVVPVAGQDGAARHARLAGRRAAGHAGRSAEQGPRIRVEQRRVVRLRQQGPAAGLGQPVQGRYSRTYCGGGSLATCRAQLTASLRSAVTALTAAQHTADPSRWTYDKAADDIRASVYGIVGIPPIDWQNRPTFQQVVSFPAHRPR